MNSNDQNIIFYIVFNKKWAIIFLDIIFFSTRTVLEKLEKLLHFDNFW